MRLPRRSPFLGSRQAELLGIYCQLYPESWYAQQHQDAREPWAPRDRREALSLVQLWLNRSACPFAVETTAVLAQSVLLDQHMQQFAASSSSSEPRFALEQMGGGVELGIRISYSMAITRFVNSIVDSYQTGGFAQSIASIAQRIGLPLWFVELRHAATHEELPSLAVCREATHYALRWLDEHFWTPQLFHGPAAIGAQIEVTEAATAPMEIETEDSGDDEEALRQEEERLKAVMDLRVALKHYRELSKRVLRDRSLAGTSRDELRKYARQVTAFVQRRRCAHPLFADRVLEMGGASRKKTTLEEEDLSTLEMDQCTVSALEQFAIELVKPGGVIPQSKTKRVAANAGTNEIVLPQEVGAIWDPLLAFLRDTFGSTVIVSLVDQLLRIITYVPHLDQEEGEDRHPASNKSYRNTADAWLRHLVIANPITSLSNTATASAPLISEAEVAQRCFANQAAALVPLLQHLCAQDTTLHTQIGSLVEVLEVNKFVETALPPSTSTTPHFDANLNEMQERLNKLQSLERVWAQKKPPASSTQDSTQPRKLFPVGWRIAPASWSPTPLGCLDGSTPNLFLEI